MATVLPPPSKRQRLAAEARARVEEEERTTIPDNLGRVRVRFHDHTSGEPTGPAVYIELKDATVKNLEILANNIDGHEAAFDRIPYNFFYQPPQTDNKQGKILYFIHTVLKNSSAGILIILSPRRSANTH